MLAEGALGAPYPQNCKKEQAWKHPLRQIAASSAVGLALSAPQDRPHCVQVSVVILRRSSQYLSEVITHDSPYQYQL